MRETLNVCDRKELLMKVSPGNTKPTLGGGGRKTRKTHKNHEAL
jgi:hypothetical protein